MLFKTHSRPLCLSARAGGALTVGLFAVAWMVALAMLVGNAFAAQPPVGLGTTDSFAVLANSTVTNTGPSTVNGDLGVSPGTAVTGFPPGTVNGRIHAADAVAGQAQSDLTTAYNDAAGRTPPVSVSGDLGGLTLTPGVYKSASSLGLTGALTLNAQGDPNAVFIFQVGSTLTTASGSQMNLINGAQPCNVFWQIGSSATLGTSSVFVGNILALTSISINDSVTVAGRALARNGAVTLINDTITAAKCATIVTPPVVTPPVVTPPVVTPPVVTPPVVTPTVVTPPVVTPPVVTPPVVTPPVVTPPVVTPPVVTPPGGTPPGGTPPRGHRGMGVFTVPRLTAKTGGQVGTSRCLHGTFRAVVTGRFIRRVVFSLGGRVVATASRSPFEALFSPGGGIHTLTAHLTFTDGTPAATLHLRAMSCAAAKRHVHQPHPPPLSQPPRSPSGFTG
jgi:hypothetical protein